VQSQAAQSPRTDSVTTVKPFQLRGRFFTAVALRLEGAADDAFFEALDAHLKLTPQFFANAPFVLDLEQAAGLERAADWRRLVEALRRRNLSVFGVQHGTPDQTAAAAEAGLIALPSGRKAPLDNVGRNAEAAPQATAQLEEPHGPASRLITDPVRSGQKVFADRGDLVVVGPVSSGAELVAVGNIHVYGALRGRALAGVNGDATARIFCQSLEAELLAIAGLYRTSEDLDPAIRKTRIQAYLKDDTLAVEALK